MSTDTRPAGLDDAEVYVRADAPEAYGRWYIRTDGTVVYEDPSGAWSDPSMVSAEKLRTSSVWAPAAGT